MCRRGTLNIYWMQQEEENRFIDGECWGDRGGRWRKGEADDLVGVTPKCAASVLFYKCNINIYWEH